MKNKMAVFGLVAVAAGVLAYTRPYNAPPSDLRDAPADSAISQLGAGSVRMPVPEPTLEAAYNGYVENNPAQNKPVKQVEFIFIPGGRFMMGTNDVLLGPYSEYTAATPVHEVNIKGFYMSKTHVTEAQYAECVKKGQCTPPSSTGSGRCSRGPDFPVVCVTWAQANQYAKFKGARLPSEAEWEYAARSGGRNQIYPWGNEPPDSSRMDMSGATLPVCSKPGGNTSQGLCDMLNSSYQYVQDIMYGGGYKNAPTDGSAVDSGYLASMIFSADRMIRGGSRCDARSISLANSADNAIGFRLAR